MFCKKEDHLFFIALQFVPAATGGQSSKCLCSAAKEEQVMTLFRHVINLTFVLHLSPELTCLKKIKAEEGGV